MLHSCLEEGRVGDDGGEVVGVDRRHDDGPSGVLECNAHDAAISPMCRGTT